MYNNAADVMTAIGNSADVDAVITILNDVNTNYPSITLSTNDWRTIVGQQSKN